VRPHRLAASALPALAVVVSTLSACGSTGTNGVATKPVDQIIQTAKTTVDDASTVHVTGDLGQGAQHITLDLRLARGKGASGTIVIGNQTLELLRVGQDVYLKGDAQFYKSIVGSLSTPAPGSPTPTTAASPPAGAQGGITIQAMQGQYLHIGPSDPSYQVFASITDPASLVDQILAGTGSLSKDGQQSIRGSKTLILSGSTPSTKVYVGIDGPAYLLRVIPAGGGTLDFLDYGSPITLQAPPASQVVEISAIPTK
jgi:hypothetical protein